MLARQLRRIGSIGATGLLMLAAWGPTVGQEETLVLTPSQAEGPYYPVAIPADGDADLTVIDGSAEVASGEPLALSGVLLRADGSPIEGAIVEIWQTDAFGVYLHPDDPGFAERDTAFQGFGRSVTDAEGAWGFLTILPEVYGSRPRHIHAKVKVADETVLTTQIYFSGGDIPSHGALEETGSELDALLIEVQAVAGEDGTTVLTADHVLVVP